MTNTIYGYVIRSTPGLIQDGSWPLSAGGIESGEVLRASDGDPVAIYDTREAAEAAMMALVPAGSTAAGYAGLSVSPATAA